MVLNVFSKTFMFISNCQENFRLSKTYNVYQLKLLIFISKTLIVVKAPVLINVLYQYNVIQCLSGLPEMEVTSWKYIISFSGHFTFVLVAFFGFVLDEDGCHSLRPRLYLHLHLYYQISNHFFQIKILRDVIQTFSVACYSRKVNKQT